MFDRWLKKKTEVVSPVKGVCIPLEQVKDSVFASKMLGDRALAVTGGGSGVRAGWPERLCACRATGPRGGNPDG